MKILSPLFNSEKKPNATMAPASRDTRLLSNVEPFVDHNIARLRLNAIDHAIVARFESELKERLASESVSELAAALSTVLAEIKADVHYLTAAYLKDGRYRDPEFNFTTPQAEKSIPFADTFKIDLRGQITGGNWYYAESDGRWAGPESESSLLFPALNKGAWKLELEIVDEIEPGTIDGMELFVNGASTPFTREGHNLPTVLVATFDVADDYKLPFWSLKMRFSKLRSPAVLHGSDDRRILAVRAAAVSFTKVGP